VKVVEINYWWYFEESSLTHLSFGESRQRTLHRGVQSISESCRDKLLAVFLESSLAYLSYKKAKVQVKVCRDKIFSDF
jgi:hypothetical protein